MSKIKIIALTLIFSLIMSIPVYAKPNNVYSNQEKVILDKLKNMTTLEYTYQLKQTYENNSFGVLKPTILTYKVRYNALQRKYYIKASSVIDILGKETKNYTNYVYNAKKGKLIKESNNLEGTEKLTETMMLTLGISKKRKTVVSLYKYLISSNIITSVTKGIKNKDIIKYSNTYKSNDKKRQVSTNIKSELIVKNNIPIKIHSKMDINIQNLKTKNNVTITFDNIKKESKNANKKKK